ncbi:glycosyltransferase family 4 protein [Parahaliea mediterranea]|uniref:glycosyltransferase family 4 protein n=1 Tax=Parahaliea mediterranea TaxID=651086 RepID=UPI0019D4E28E|nr:glycosyltransferase family 4 protein [Parahaliea mediterranea]
MKLGLVGPLPPPNGGMAMQTEQLARLLREDGVQVDVLAVNAPYRPRWIGRVRGVRALFRLLPYLWQCWRLLGRVDLVHLMANSGWSWQLFATPLIWLASWRRVPVIVNYRGGGAAEYLEQAAPRVLPTLRRASVLAVPSGFLQAVFNGYGVPSQVVPNIVDTRCFAPVERLPDRALPLRLAVTRNLEPIYGLDTAIRALAHLQKARPGSTLTIAGSGPQRAALEALAAELGLAGAVYFAGRLSREEIAALYAQSDVLLNPARVDNMPNSVLEAMACGLPVVSTAVGGVPYIIDDGATGLLVAPDAPEAMAEAVLQLVDDAARYRAIAAAALAQTRAYTWPAVREQWLNLYRTTVAAA